jgi:hypothetical protein
MDAPPLHERTFPRSLPHKRGRCREAIGMGLAHHRVYLTFHSHMILEIRQYPEWWGNFWLVVNFGITGERQAVHRPDFGPGPDSHHRHTLGACLPFP